MIDGGHDWPGAFLAIKILMPLSCRGSSFRNILIGLNDKTSSHKEERFVVGSLYINDFKKTTKNVESLSSKNHFDWLFPLGFFG